MVFCNGHSATHHYLSYYLVYGAFALINIAGGLHVSMICYIFAFEKAELSKSLIK